MDISTAIASHRNGGKLATLTAVQPPGRYGALNLVEGDQVAGFQGKPQCDGGWINGGFFVLEPGVFDMISSDSTTWEAEPLQGLAAEGQLQAYRHQGFWQPMDTLRDRVHLEELWASGKAPSARIASGTIRSAAQSPPPITLPARALAMRSWGLWWGWLLIPHEQAVEVWPASGDPQRFEGIAVLEAGPEYPGLQLQMEEIWAA